MKKLSLILFGLLLCSCSDSKLESIVTNNFNFKKHVMYLPTGEITIPATSEAKHTLEELGGAKLNSTTYVLSKPSKGYDALCKGCDSCLTAFDKKGLIKYEVITDEEGTITATVELTTKGEKYLLTNTSEEDEKLVSNLKDKGIYLVVVSNETFGKTSNKVKESDEIFNFDFTVYNKYTPFGEALGAKTDKDKATVYEGRYNEGEFSSSRKE